MNIEHAADGFAMANGITFNSGKSRIYVADLFGKTVTVLKRDKENNKLTKLRTIQTNHLPDNIKFDHENGKIYAGTLERGYHLLNFDNPP
jgi:DNA-binding beta-propeller fold protein YncE